MKSVKILVQLVFISTIFFSCSKESNEPENIIPNTIKLPIRVETNSPSVNNTTTLFTYEGLKIKRIDIAVGNSNYIEKTYIECIYSGNLITQTKSYQLIQGTYKLAGKIDYNYNSSSELINAERYSYNTTTGEESHNYSENRTYEEVNNIKIMNQSIEYIGSNGFQQNKTTYLNDTTIKTESVGLSSESNGTFIYNNKKNPFSNITGWDKIYAFSPYISATSVLSNFNKFNLISINSNYYEFSDVEHVNLSNQYAIQEQISYNDENEVINEITVISSQYSSPITHTFFYD